MSGKLSSRGLRIRSSEDKLYQACLDACIEGIEKLPVSIRRTSVLPVTVERDDNNNNSASTEISPALTPAPLTLYSPSIELANLLPTTPLPTTPQPASSLLSPPATPKKTRSPNTADSSSATFSMNHAPLHGAPVRGQVPPHLRTPARPAPSTYSNQDSRSNLAVQPAASTGGTLKLKKSAVKVVGAAAPAPPPSVPHRAPAPAPAPATATAPAVSSPAPGPVKTQAKEAERVENASSSSTTKSTPPAAAAKPVQHKVEPSSSKTSHLSSDLDGLFARLTTGAISLPSPTTKASSPAAPHKSEFTFGDSLDTKGTASVAEASKTSHLSATAKVFQSNWSAAPAEQKDQTKAPKDDAMSKTAEPEQGFSQKGCEQEYIRKAAEYVDALPNVTNVSVQTIKTVAAKLRSIYSPDSKLSPDEVERLKARFVFAIVNYINNVLKQSASPTSADAVKKALQDCDGNMLALCGALVAKGHLKLDDIKGVVDLFKMIQDVLPKAEPVTWTPNKATEPTKTSADGLKAWPTQEKRENPAMHRACILKGVSGVKNINELQALVWGGRLESIAMPSPGSDFAVVRFLTPEACEKYFKATENGIEIQGDLRKGVVFVEKQPGPTSINDVMQNCIDGDASRCVRAMDAEEDWSDMQLMSLARGKGTVKREVERIKRGKTAQGRYFIEFRFANIYHALNFKRALQEDEDWEACTLSYATDPCETAQGVHYKDEDEQSAGFFA